MKMIVAQSGEDQFFQLKFVMSPRKSDDIIKIMAASD